MQTGSPWYEIADYISCLNTSWWHWLYRLFVPQTRDSCPGVSGGVLTERLAVEQW